MGWKEKRATRQTEKAERRAAEKERLARQRAEQARRMTIWQAKFLGGTKETPELNLGQTCGLTFQPEGLRIFYDSTPMDGRRNDVTAIELSGADVRDVSVADSSQVHTLTQIKKKTYGLFGGMFRTMPVAVSGTQTKLHFFLLLDSTRGAYSFEVNGYDPDSLVAHVELCRASWGMTEPDQGTEPLSEAAADPTQVLKQLAELHQSGVLDDAEFSEKKAEILKRI